MDENNDEHYFLLYSNEDIEANIKYLTTENKLVLAKKLKKKPKLSNKFFNQPTINKSVNILGIKKYLNDNLLILQEFNGFIPFNIYIKESNAIINNLYTIMIKLIKLDEDPIFYNNFSNFIDINLLWIDKNFNLKICWVTFLIKNEKYLDNSLLKVNIHNLEDFWRLYNHNKKRLEKRKTEKVNDKHINEKNQEIVNNFFLYNECKSSKDIKYDNKIISLNRGIVKVCGTKKLCIDTVNSLCKTKTKHSKNLFGIKLLLLQIVFLNEKINQKNSSIYFAKLRNIHLTKSSELFQWTDELSIVIKFILDITNTKIFDCSIKNEPNLFIKNYVKKIENFFLKSELKKPENKNDDETFVKPFKEKGYDMKLLNTKSFQKGRFLVCQAVPTVNIRDFKTRINLKKIVEIIEIQNRQIEIMYQKLKSSNKMEHIIDKQLESLSLQANEILSDLEDFDF